MSEETRLREKWPWNEEFLRLLLIVPSAVGVTAAASTYAVGGVHALWFLTGILIGVVLYAVYGGVGRRVQALKENYAGAGGDLAEALIATGTVQSPGVVVLNGLSIELLPIVGAAHRIPDAAQELIGEGHWLPGKYVWGKRAFTFRAGGPNPLAFAVAESVGARWSAAIRGGALTRSRSRGSAPHTLR